NIFTNIIDASTVNSSGNIIDFRGGTLDMHGFAIGPVGGGTGGTRHIGTVMFPSFGNVGVLANLGGTGINDAGLTLALNGTHTTVGTLVLEGNNNYPGGTTITAGTLQVGQASDTVAPSLALQGPVTNNSTLAFGSSQALTFSSAVSGSG